MFTNVGIELGTYLGTCGISTGELFEAADQLGPFHRSSLVSGGTGAMANMYRLTALSGEMMTRNLPATCLNCGLTFSSPIVATGRMNAYVDNSMPCPRCGGPAPIADATTDALGNVHIREAFKYLRSIDDPVRLRAIKSKLEAVSQPGSGAAVAAELDEVDAEFGAMVAAYLKDTPRVDVVMLAKAFVALLTLWLVFRTYQATTQGVAAQEAQVAISAAQFEYQKARDAKQDSAAEALRQDPEQLLQRIQQLERSVQDQLETRSGPYKQQRPAGPTERLKGADRNKPCACGSGMKAKKCHPNGC